MSILTWIEDKKRLKLLNAPKNFAQFSDSNKGLWTRCDKCGVILYIKHLKENQRVCFGCSYHLQMMSGERIENLLDKVPLKRNFDRIRDDRIRDENDGFPSDSRRDRRERDRRERDQKESQPCIAFNDGSAKKTSRISETSKVYKNTGERSHRLLVENDRSAKSSDKKRNFGFAERSSRVNEVRAESSGTRIDFRENMISTWRPLDETLSPCDPLKFADQRNYKDRLQDAQEKTGLQDAVQTGTGMIDGIPVALAVMDFSFMGGSMGSVVGEKITRLIEYATQEGLTLIIVSASGGARMQEGVFSLMQMAKISSALQIYQSCAKLLYISILTSPTTGGVTASFAMLGDIIFAEPKALIAFAGRRVIEQTLCEDLPDDFQTSEYMLHHGLVDLIVPRRFLRQALSETIRLYQKAPFKKRGRIEFGVQNPITFLTEEKIRRQWVRTMGSIDAGNALNDSSPIQSSLLCKSLLRKPSQSLLSKPSESLLRKPYLATQDKQMQSGLYPLQRSIAYDKPKMKSEDLPSWCIASAEPRRERDRRVCYANPRFARVCGANQARGGSPQVMQVVGDAPRLSHSGVKRPALYASAKYENEQYREILTSFRTMLDLFFPTADKKNFFLPISRNQTKSTDVYVQSKTLYSSPYGQALYTPARIHPQQSFRMYFNLRLKNEFYTNKNLIRRLKYSLFYFLFKKTIFLTEGSSMVRTKLRFVSKKGSKREILFADTYKAHTLLRKASERNSLCKQARGFFQESKNSTSVMQMQGNNQNGNLPSYLSRKPTFFRKNDRLEIGEGAGLQASERNSFALMRNRKGKLRQRDQGHSRCYVPIARLPFLKKVVNHKNLRGAIFSISSTAKISDFLSFRALQKNSLDKTLFYKASVPTKAKLLQSKALSKLVQSKASNSKMNDRAPKVIDQVLQNGLYAESKNSNLFYKRSICREYLTKRSSVGNRFTLDYKIKLLHVFDLYGPDLINEILQSLATHQRVIKQDFIENEKNRTRDKEEKLNKFKIEGRRSGDKQNIYQSYPDFKNQENNLSLLNQAIEMAATESVEWRAFYVDQQLSEKIGLLDDFSSPILKLINNSNEDLLNVANMIFYRLICRSKKVVEKK